MSYIGVGGDTSVQWIVEADGVRQTLVHSAGRSHRHEGIDDTPRNGKFRIVITAPREDRSRAEFYRALQKAIDDKSNLEVVIPIEDTQPGRRGNLEQVQVRWTSSKQANSTGRIKRVSRLQD